MSGAPRRRPPMHLEFGGTDDFWTDPDRRYEGHLRTLMFMVTAIVLIVAAAVLLSDSLLIVAVMLVPAAVLTALLTWHTRPRGVPDYRDGPRRRRRSRISSSGR